MGLGNRFGTCPTFNIAGGSGMTEYAGEERRNNVCNSADYMTHDMCRREHDSINRDIDSKYEESLRDRKSLHDAVCEIKKDLASSRKWLIGTLITVLLACIGTIWSITRDGGFAKASDMADLKSEVRVMKTHQDYMAKIIEDIRNDQIRRERKEK